MSPGTEQRKLAAIMFTDMVGLGYVNADPIYDRLRSEPPSIALLRKMGLQK